MRQLFHSFSDEKVYLYIIPMESMKEWVDRILEEERRRRNIPLEVKRPNGNYYL